MSETEQPPGCDPCREANADYKREWRSRSGVGERDRRRNEARRRALWRLAQEHPLRFRELLADELSGDSE
jgi:hypothetical protein